MQEHTPVHTHLHTHTHKVQRAENIVFSVGGHRIEMYLCQEKFKEVGEVLAQRTEWTHSYCHVSEDRIDQLCILN